MGHLFDCFCTALSGPGAQQPGKPPHVCSAGQHRVAGEKGAEPLRVRGRFPVLGGRSIVCFYHKALTFILSLNTAVYEASHTSSPGAG